MGGKLGRGSANVSGTAGVQPGEKQRIGSSRKRFVYTAGTGRVPLFLFPFPFPFPLPFPPNPKDEIMEF